MHDSLELLLADIYALDPKLRERDAEVRVLVRELLDNKPTVKVSEVFAQNLRAKLLTPRAVPALRPQASIPSPWLRYFVPLGAIAVLLLMLVPNYVGQPTMYDSVTPSVAPVSAPESFSAPDNKRSAPSAPEGASMMMLEDAAMPVSDGNSLGLGMQMPGVVVLVDYVSLLEPGFVVISRSENGQIGAVLGVSYLLFSGYNEQIEIPLSESMKAGETFIATLYLDNGDGIFDINSDTPLYDLDGVSPLSREFLCTL